MGVINTTCKSTILQLKKKKKRFCVFSTTVLEHNAPKMNAGQWENECKHKRENLLLVTIIVKQTSLK